MSPSWSCAFTLTDLVCTFIVPSKGSNPSAIRQITRFINETCLIHVCYRSDKEFAIRSMMNNACALSGRRGILVKTTDPSSAPDVELEPGDVPAVEKEQELQQKDSNVKFGGT